MPTTTPRPEDAEPEGPRLNDAVLSDAGLDDAVLNDTALNDTGLNDTGLEDGLEDIAPGGVSVRASGPHAAELRTAGSRTSESRNAGTRRRTHLQVYARPGRHMTRQVSGDLFLVAWTVLWVVVARWVKHMVDALATPARELANAARDVANSSGHAGEDVQHVPGIGGTIASPFQTLQQQLGSVQQSANHQVELIHHLAWAVAIVTVAIPVAVVAVRWLPGRLRFIREATAARRMADSDADLDLFALRAMAHLPLSQLVRVSEDPVGAWRRGDRAVIDRLAELELRRANLELRRPRGR